MFSIQKHSISIVMLTVLCIALTVVGAKAASAPQTLTVSWDNNPDSLNPALTGYLPVDQIDRNVFDTLTWETPDEAITPYLATNWKISDGGRTYTFWLRHDVKFQDGTPFDAAAVVTNLNYIANPATHSISAVGSLGPYKSSRAVGRYEVVVNFTSPYAPCLARFGEPLLGMQSPAAIAKYPKNPTMLPVGSGPYEFASFTPNSRIVLVRNPGYHWSPPALHGQGPGNINKVIYDIVESGQARVNQLQTGEAQLVNNTPGLYFKTLGSDPAYRAVSVPVSGVPVSAVINNSKWPTNSTAVRQAIIYSIDRAGVIKLADSGQYPQAWGPVQKGTVGYDPRLNGMYPYNPAQAAHILTAVGWKKVGGIWTKDGRRLTIQISTNPNFDFPLLAQAIQGYLQKAGMVATIKTMATPAWVGSMLQGEENMSPAFSYTDVDADVLRLMFTKGQYFNWWKYDNSKVTQLLNSAVAEVNTAKRLQMYGQAQQIIMKDAATMPIHVNGDLVMTSSKLTGMGLYPGGPMVFYTASIG